MGVLERRVDERVDLVGDLLSVSCDAFPNRLVGRRLGPRRPGSDAGGPPARDGR